MPFASLRLCEKILNPVNPVNPVKKRLSSAFTLVETALALLAIGLGLIALFGIGRLALESSREAENDRRCAMMADAIFETLRAVNAVYINEARTIGQEAPGGDDDPANPSAAQMLDHWNRLWSQEVLLRGEPPAPLWDTNGRLLFPPVAGMSADDIPLIWIARGRLVYHPSDEQYLVVNTVDPNNAFAFFLTYNKQAPLSLADWRPLYQLEITDLDSYRYYSPTAGTYSAKQVTLVIFPDGLTASSDQRIFTTTLSNTGGMP